MAKGLVFAMFSKPENCEACPCSFMAESPFSDNICQLKLYTDGFLSEYELHNDRNTPDWCPLKEIKLTV
jgi:hypothetical protein